MSVANYWSCAMEGVPFGVRYPSESMAREAARNHIKAHKDIERIQIVEVMLVSHGYEDRPYDPFGGLVL